MFAEGPAPIQASGQLGARKSLDGIGLTADAHPGRGRLPMLRTAMIAVLMLAACQKTTTPEGCPIMLTEIGRAYTQGCIAAYYEERARQSGHGITKCYESAGGFTCITE